MRSYQDNDPKGWGGDPLRGAALGRNDIQEETKEYEGVLTVTRVKLDEGGYDENSIYFGIGPPLFWISNEEGTVDFMVRSADKTGAKEKVLRRYPLAQVS